MSAHDETARAHSVQTDDEAALAAFVDDVRVGSGVTGIAVGVLHGDRRLTAVSGIANAETGRPVGASTLFQVGSISKTFASAMVMVLVGDGLVSLADPVAKYLPDLATAAPALRLGETTIRQLLDHTSGFDGDHLLTRREGHDLTVLADAARLFAPGEGWSYSNAGFTLVGAVIEAVTGASYAAAVRASLLKPLGMVGAGFRADDVVTFDVAAPHWVHDGTSHVIRGAGWQPGWELEPLDHAPGGLIASIEHLVTWCRFHLDGRSAHGETILTGARLDALHTATVQARRGVGIGLDWFVEAIDGVTAIGHGGVTAGYVSDVLIVPEADLGVVVSTNATNGAVAVKRIRRWVLEHHAGLIERDEEVTPGSAPTIESVCGRYRHAFGDLTVTPGERAGTIVITTEARRDVAWQPPADPPTVCGFVDTESFVALELETQPAGAFGWGPMSTDTRDDTHLADWILWHERRALRVD